MSALSATTDAYDRCGIPGIETLVDLALARSRRQPDETAYTFLDDGEEPAERLTYRELDTRARAFALRLDRQGLRGQRVLLLFPPGLELITALFGCFYAGAVAVPTFPPRLNRKSRRLEAVLADAGPRAVLAPAELLPRIEKWFSDFFPVPGLTLLPGGGIDLAEAQAWQPRAVSGEDLAFLQYTSGSTSTPKGAMVTHANLLHNSSYIHTVEGNGPDSVGGSWLPAFHDMGLIEGVLQPLFGGYPCYLMAPAAFLRKPLRWLRMIDRFRVTNSGGPNFAYELCVARSTPEEREALDLGNWRVAYNGAEPVRTSTLDRFAAAFEPSGFRWRSFYPVYGMAEATLVISSGGRDDEPLLSTFAAGELETHKAVEVAAGDPGGRQLVGCGRVGCGVRVAIAHPGSNRTAAAGEVGEIWVAGPSVVRGYWNRPEQTARTFGAHLSDTGEGPFLRTGDLGFLHRGQLFITGRLKDLLIIRGRNHYPQDIELTVEKAHPGLRPGSSAAFSVEVEGEERLVVVCEPERRARVAAEEVAEAVRRAISEEHQVHLHELVLLRFGTVPKTTSGKIRRQACRAGYLDGTLEVAGRSRAADPATADPRAAELSREALEDLAPADRASVLADFLRRRIAAHLRVEPRRVSLDAALDSLGLDSLEAAEVAGGLEAALGLSLPFSALLGDGSLGELCAEAVRRFEASAGRAVSGPEVLAAESSEHPLSYGQQGIWFLERLAPGSAAYHIALAARIEGELDTAAFGRALGRLSRRHGALRTVFTAVEGEEPTQRVLAEMPLSPSVVEVSEPALKDRLLEEVDRPFDLAAGPLLRAVLFKAGDTSVLLLVIHHIVADLWSLGLLMADLREHYRRECGAPPAALVPVGLGCGEYARWQRRRLSQPEAERLRTYWETRLADAPAALDLPADRLRPAVRTFRGARTTRVLRDDLADRVEALARDRGATLFMTLLAVFYTLLYRYTGARDLLVGSPTANRSAAGPWADLVGYLVNPVVLRARISGEPSFGRFLAEIRRTVLEAMEHGEYPFPLLAERLQPDRELSRSPIFQVMFAHQRNPLFDDRQVGPFALGEEGASLGFGDVTLKSFRLPTRWSQFDMTLMTAPLAAGLGASLCYASDLFDRTTAARMLSHFTALLESAAENPRRTLGALEMSRPAERFQMLREWNPGSSSLRDEAGLSELFAERAARSPEAVAVVFEESAMSFRELRRRADRLACRLQQALPRAGSREALVGICVERSLAMVVGILGILRSGAAYVPLDPAHPRDRLTLVAEDAGIRALVTQKDLGGRLEVSPRVARLLIHPDGRIPGPRRGSSPAPAAGRAPERLAYTIYTSGSTGRPKGVQISHRCLAGLLRSTIDKPGISDHDTLVAVVTPAFDISVVELFLPLVTGARLVVASAGEAADGRRLARLFEASKATVLEATPATYDLLLEGGFRPGGARLICSGEALSRDLAQRLLGLGGELWNLYGPTEVTVWSSGCRVEPGEGPVSIGEPIAGRRIHVLDRRLAPVPVGVPGELHIGGAGLARGYLGRPGLTADKFIPDPLAREPGRLYVSGDLVRYRPDGRIEYLGRRDHQVKIRGFRIELGEIEGHLRAHPAVAEAVVVSCRSAAGEPRLAACFTPAGESSPGADALRGFLRRKLPEYMLPTFFVERPALPLNANGKVDRKALITGLGSPAEALTGASGRGALDGPVEETLAAVWSELLEVAAVDPGGDFFELGGHSLSAARLAGRLRDALGVELSLRDLFESSTLSAMARKVEAALRRGPARELSPPRPSVDAGMAPLSFAQERLWFLDRLEGGGATYNMAAAVRLSGPLEVGALKGALRELVRRHGALRTSFRESPAGPVQVVEPAPGRDPALVDLTALTEAGTGPLAARLAGAEARRPFDLSRGPLARFYLLRRSADEHLLVVNVHHTVCDGESMRILVQELALLYRSAVEDRSAPLAELPLEYTDFARWQRSRSTERHIAPLLDYWKEQLAGLAPVLELPTDRPRASHGGGAARKTEVTLGADLARELRRFYRQRGATPFMALLAGFQALLGRLSAQQGFAVGSPVTSRQLTEVEGLIGPLVDTLVLRADLVGDPSFEALLGRVRETVLQAHAHRELPFERLVEELQPERSLHHAPLFQVFFSLQPDPLRGLEMPGLGVDFDELETGAAPFVDLTLSFFDREDGITGVFEYDSGLFDATSVKRLGARLEHLLGAALAVPGEPMSRQPFVTAGERHQLLREWHGGADGPRRAGCVHELFESWAERTPEAPAAIVGRRVMTYRELNARANRLARRLRELGVGPEVRAAVVLDRSPELPVALLAVLKAGGAYVPLNPGQPRERLARMLEGAAAPVVLTSTRQRGSLPGNAAEVLWLDREAEALERLDGSDLESTAGPAHAAYVIYTSGSTGTPKGVIVEHRDLVHFTLEMGRQLGLGRGDRILQFASLGFDVVEEELYPTWARGGAVVFEPRDLLLSGTEFSCLVARRGVTGLELPAAYWHEWVADLASGAAELPPALRFVIVGSEKPSPERVAQWSDFGVPLFVVFGLTETTITTTLHRADPVPGAGLELPVGRPVGNARVYLLDERSEPLPMGMPGELAIGGTGLARGYLDRPALTAERFVPDPMSGRPGRRLYLTGDRARFRRRGDLELIGRLDHQVKLRGFRVEPGEIEDVLIRLPEVREAVVAARREGSGRERLVAYAVPSVDVASSARSAFGQSRDIELWPETGLYHVYDEVLYHAMTSDEVRNRSYRAAMDRLVRDRLVVDVGTGADATLARMCAAAGARKVYAVEVLRESYEKAREYVASLGLDDKITLVHGDAMSAEIPEKADVCVSELLGTIGSSEGVVPILNQAWRFLKPGGSMIPWRCATRIAAVRLPRELESPAFTPTAAHYVEKVFETVGREFDLRLCIRNFPADHVISSSDCFEDLLFTAPISASSRREVTLTVSEDSRFDGFLLWLTLFTFEGHLVDVLEQPGCWSPSYFPICSPGIEVSRGDRIHLVCSFEHGSASPGKPDYRIEGELRRRDGTRLALGYDAPFAESSFRASPFYSSLFADGGPAVRKRTSARDLIETLRRGLEGRLPDYMVPSAFVLLDRLPVSANGKIDRAALPSPAVENESRDRAEPRTAEESLLADVWAEVLGVGPIGIHDNFFELGGDSIQSLQVVAVARRAGLGITPRQLFEHQTVARLARVAEPAAVPTASEQGPVTGAVPLTPVQRMFFEAPPLDPHHWNQSLLLELRQGLDPGRLRRAVAELLAHHDGLRLRFERRAGGWRQRLAPPGGPVPFCVVDLSAMPGEARSAAQSAVVAEVQGSLDLAGGPLVRAAWIETGAEQPVRLLLAVHHLVVDGVSWRILTEDLAALCEGGDLPPKTTSLKRWSELLAARAHSEEAARESDYWLARQPTAPLPVDFPGGENVEAWARETVLELDAGATRQLLSEVGRAYNTRINDVLLTALARTLARFHGDDRVLVDLEGHGRAQILPGIDLSRTVGYFTTIFPVVLDLEGASEPGAALRRVKEQLRAVPGDGLGYGLLRYLGDQGPPAERVRSLPRAEVLFNYLGQLDVDFPAGSPVARAIPNPGADRAPRGHRQHALEINCGVKEGRLEMAWTFSSRLHHPETVERLAAGLTTELRSLIRHCRTREARGYTPSDFPLAALAQNELDLLVERYRAIEDVYPLSPMQEGMLFHVLSEPRRGAYFAQLHGELRGEVDASALELAWRRVVERHPALRTGFVSEGATRPLQVVLPAVDFALERHDFREIPEPARGERIEAWLAEDRRRGITLSRPPLMRFALIRLGRLRYHFVWTHHQMAIDGWSLPRLFAEVLALYRGDRAALGAPRPYRDYIAWLERQDLTEVEAYWRRRLAGFTRPTPIGLDEPRTATDSPGAAREQHLRLSTAATETLFARAAAHRLTLSTLAQGAWALLLSRYSGDRDVVFGVTVSGRPPELKGVEEMVGMFVNTLPMRMDVPAGESLCSWLQRFQAAQAELRQYEHTPLSSLQRWLDWPQGSPLFESFVVFQNYPIRDGLEADGGLELGEVRTSEQGNYPLAAMIVPGPRVAVQLEYDPRRFTATAAGRLLGHLRTLLESIARDPSRPLSEVSLLSASQRGQVLREWNDTASHRPGETCLHEHFEARAAWSPEASAAIFRDRRLTYRELDASADRLARELRRLGVGPESRVGVSVGRSPAMAVALLGVMKAGAAFVPLDPSYPRQRLALLLEDAGAGWLVTEKALLEKLPETGARTICLDGDPFAATGAAVPEPGATPGNLAYAIYTSGSTGRPKGVLVDHRALVHYAVEVARQLELGPGDRVLQFASFGFDVVEEELFPAWLSGAAVVFESADRLGSIEGLTRVLERQEVTVVELPAPFWHEWVHEIAAGRSKVPPSLRLVLVGSEKPSPAALETWAETGVELAVVFGLTETTITSTVHRVSGGEAEPPIGRPVANTAVYVLGDRQEPVPLGAAGELYIGGAGLARGYLGRAGRTAERFLPEPFADAAGARMYRTGDRARLRPDGNLAFLGRLDHQLKVRGFRIEPGEIEAVLNRHPAVRESVVMSRDSRQGRRLVAYVAASTGASVPPAGELRGYLRERLPDHMVPALFVALDGFPRTAHGKLDRSALPAPDGERPDSASGFAAPRDATEKALAEIWSRVLGIDQVGIHDHFFELGGDSILSLQVVSRAHGAGLRLSPKQIFEHPTVGELAAVASPAGAAASPQGAVTGDAPLTPIQRWLLDQELKRPDHWNMPLLLELRRPLDATLLARAMDRVTAHHDALRLRFAREASGWRQFHVPAPQPVPVLRVSFAEVTEPSRAIAAAVAELQASLDLARGPLLRMALFEPAGRGLGGGRESTAGQLLIVAHHLIVDGVSWRVLLEDLEAVYEGLSRGREVELAPKTTSYKRWAEHLAEHARSAQAESEARFWLDRPVPPPLPVDFPGGANTAGSERTVELALGTRRTRALLREVPAAYRTRIDDVLLSALARGLARWSGHEELWVELESHGREELAEEMDLARTVGWFTSLYPVAFGPWALEEPGAALKAVKEYLRSLPGRGLSYGLLRHLGDGETAEALRALPRPRLIFENAGQLDPPHRAGALFDLSVESPEPVCDPAESRPHELGLIAGVRRGRLRLTWSYSENLHRRATVERLAAMVLEELEALVDHCLAAEAVGRTPSDFPLASVTQEALDRLAARHGAIEDLYPLSPVQQGMLFHNLYESGAGMYVAHLGFELTGSLDTAAFRWAWQQVVSRHAALRTAFAWEDLEEPLQVVRETADLALERRDWRGLDEDRQRDRLAELWRRDRRRGFSLDQAPLARLSLVRLEDDRYALTWTLHQSAIDGWSLPVVLRDLLAAYRARLEGSRLDLAPAPPYRDYVAWLGGKDPADAQGYWRRQLAGFTRANEIGLAPAAPGGGGDLCHEETCRLSAPATAALQGMGKSCGLTVNTVVQAAWAALVSRYSGDSDVVFGAVTNGRPADLRGVESMVGLFINTLPVRVRLSAAEPAREAMARLQLRQAASRDFEFTPLNQVRTWSEVPAGSPLFESILGFENYPSEELAREVAGLAIRPTRTREQSNYPLTVVVEPGRRYSFSIAYYERRFDRSAVGRMLGHLRSLLEGVSAEPERPLPGMPILTRAEGHQLLSEWNDGRPATDLDAGLTAEATLCELFERQVAARPDAVAVGCETELLSYRELNARANRLARHLCSRGVLPRSRVAVYLDRSAELVTAILGVQKAGCAYLPIDLSHPEERVGFLLEDGEAAAVVTDDEQAGFLPAGPEVVCVDRDREAIRRQSSGDPGLPACPADTSYVIYTSGTTGRPKGVMVPHANVVRLFAATRGSYRFGPQDVWTLFHTCAFDFSVWELWGALLHGGRLEVIPYWISRSPHDFYELLRNRKVTVLNQTPSAFRQLMLADSQSDGPAPPLAWVVFGGEALDVHALAPWWERHGDAAPRLVNMYGITETTVHVTFRALSREDLSSPASVLGAPVSDLTVHLCDRRLHPVPVGLPGEICVGGAGSASGYLNRSGLTALRFVPDPMALRPGARLYRSGDLARRLAHGDLEYLGRIDRQLKVRGFRIEAGEIESALRAHPAVEDCVVVARADGGAEKSLVAYLVVGDQALAPAPRELRAALEDRLPQYMIPAAFVALEALPLTANGKLDRRALPAPEQVRAALEQGYREPRNDDEAALARVWAEVLGLERVGIDDDFFELGGDSILSIQIVVKARRAGLRLSPKQLFDHPTVARLAAVVGETEAAAVDAPALGTVPLTPIQRWFFEQRQPDPQHWNQSVLLTVRPGVEPASIRRAVAALLDHHDALRSRFERRGEEWHQECVAWDGRLPWSTVDLGQAPAEVRGPAIEAAAGEIQPTLDLGSGPLVRVVLLACGPGEPDRLLFVVHHLVIDDVSWRILLEDLETACRQLGAGQEVRLPPRSTSYKRWSERLAERAASESKSAEAGYWRELLSGAEARLPCDFAGGVNDEASAATLSVALSAEETGALLREVPGAYNTQINDALVAALALAFHERLGRPLRIDLEGHGREEIFEDLELSRTVGWFTALFPVVLDASESPGPGEALKKAKEHLRRIPDRGVGYQVLRYLSADPTTPPALAAAPRSEVLFNYQGQLDLALPESSLFALADESSGPPVGPRARRPYLLEINASVREGRLRLDWTYSGNLHRQATIRALAESASRALGEIIRHCRELEKVGFTPSDFPEIDLDQAQLDELMAELETVAQEIEA